MSDTLHEVLARGIDKGLRDVGAELSGCTPSMLTGHLIRELRAAGLHPLDERDAAVRDSEYLRSRLAAVLTELLRGGTTYRDRCQAAYAALAPDGTAVCAHAWPRALLECPKCDVPAAATPPPEEQR